VTEFVASAKRVLRQGWFSISAQLELAGTPRLWPAHLIPDVFFFFLLFVPVF
jgi:hypothetical protein